MPSRKKAVIEITAEDKTSRDLKRLSRNLDETSKKMKSLGKGLSAAVTLPATIFGASAFQEFREFQAEMAKVQAVSGAAGKEFDALKKNAENLGAATRFSAVEVAGLQLEYSKLGFASDEITQVTKATLALAQASGEELADAAATAGSTLRAFGIDASETGRVTDVMAKSFSTSALDLERFRESMKLVAPVSKAAGISLEETSGLLATLADNGISGSAAGTALRRILNDLSKEGQPLNDVLSELGKQNLNLADAESLVGKNAQSALLILANNAKKAKELTSTYESAKGAAQGMANVMDNTAEGSIARLSSAFSALKIQVGGLIAEVVVPLIENLSPVIGRFGELEKSTQKIILVMAGTAAAVGPVLLLLAPLVSAFASVATAMASAGGATTVLGAAFAALTGPVGITVLALAAGAALVIANWDKVKSFAISFSGQVVAAFEDWRARNAETIASITQSLDSVIESVTRIAASIATKIQESIAWLDAFLEPLGGISGAWESLKIVITAVIDTLTGLVGDWFKGLASNFSTIADVLEGNKTAWEGLKEIVGGALSFMLSKVKEAIEGIKTAFSSVDWGSLGRAAMEGIKDGIVSGAKGVVSAGKGALSDLVSAGKGVLKINSPSKVFMKMGVGTMAGLAMGIAQGAPMAEKASESAAMATLAAFDGARGVQNSFSGDSFSSNSQPGSGSFGDSSEQSSIPGGSELEAVRSFYDQRLAILTESGQQETAVARDLEMRRGNELASIRQTQIAGYGQSFDGILSLTRSFAGEQSGIYQGLFAASKGFAIAESVVSIQTSVAKAAAAGFPKNIPLIASAVSQGASILSTIRGTNLQSFEGGGFTGSGARTGGVDGRGGFNAVLHPNEQVIDMQRGQSMGGNLTVNITVNGEATPEQVSKIEMQAVSKAIQMQADIQRRGGNRAAAFRP